MGFGELALIREGTTRTASIKCQTPVILSYLTKKDYLYLFGKF